MRKYLVVALACLAACSQTDQAAHTFPPAFDQAELFPGGETSVSALPFASLEKPAANMADALKPNFHAGKALANQPWVKAPTTTTARDGLGPIYNARTCLSCHIKGGKGNIPLDNDSPLTTTLVRLSVPTTDALGNDPSLITHGLIPHPVYGDQIQNQSISLAHQLRNNPSAQNLAHDVAPEAYINIQWIESQYKYPDGSITALRRPELDVRYLGYGSFGDDTLFSIRVAPSIHGMGLLALIDQQDLNALADESDANQDGISGKVNLVWDVQAQALRPGRFGLKSNKPTLEMIVAAAFKNDVGISNPLFPDQPCSSSQADCLKQPNGNDAEGVELPQHLLDLVVDFNRNLAPLQRDEELSKAVSKGRTLFYESGCHQCHQPSFKTQESTKYPHLSEQIIWPYSDLLLHDMGEALADYRPEFLADGKEWRTAPLWNLGYHPKVNGSHVLLHDGRARNVEEAILWHGGEAQKAKDQFVHLPKSDRDALIEFVYSL
ncbi:MAG: hypothetical protein HWE18_10565 [Gammaproteobacteria bacterium]|nr:hypothetical protein [Gammaproteobacteria bacterium]